MHIHGLAIRRISSFHVVRNYQFTEYNIKFYDDCIDHAYAFLAS